MGSIISLGVNRMEIDWGKNNYYKNHSKLFQNHDFGKEIPYYYIDNNNKEFIEYKEGASKQLSEVTKSLEILGYTLKNIEKIYNENLRDFKFYTDENFALGFEDFFKLIKSLDLTKVNNIESIIESYDNGFDLGEYFNRCILEDKEFSNKIN